MSDTGDMHSLTNNDCLINKYRPKYKRNTVQKFNNLKWQKFYNLKRKSYGLQVATDERVLQK